MPNEFQTIKPLLQSVLLDHRRLQVLFTSGIYYSEQCGIVTAVSLSQPGAERMRSDVEPYKAVLRIALTNLAPLSEWPRPRSRMANRGLIAPVGN